MIFKCFLLLFFSTSLAYADFDQSQLNFGVGVINVSFTETESGLPPKTSGTVTEEETIASGSVPVTAGFLEYEKFLGPKYSVLARSSFPILPSSTGSYVFVGSGLNYYFNSLSSAATFKSKEAEITIIPRWRFHAGGGLGGAYLIYNTETAKKNDTLVELYANTGITMNSNRNLGYRSELIFARGIGFNSTATVIKIFFGITHSLDI